MAHGFGTQPGKGTFYAASTFEVTGRRGAKRGGNLQAQLADDPIDQEVRHLALAPTQSAPEAGYLQVAQPPTHSNEDCLD